jgi:putative tricarboxylic transport membrane protein
MYGGSTTSILMNIPGETASVVTCLDGYQMALQGRAGPALGIAAFGSFIAGTVGLVILMFLALAIANFALRFGPPEYFALMMLAVCLITYLGSGPMLKTLAMITLGFFLAIIGTDVATGRERFTFGIDVLENGVGLVTVAMGVFGLGEIFTNVEKMIKTKITSTRITHLLPDLKDWKDSFWPIIRGSFLGFFLGILPGGGGILASFVSYTIEKKFSKTPEQFGKGAIQGVAGPEAANNAGSSGAFVPMLAMGIPSNVTMAILLGLLLVHGVEPGPLLAYKHPDIFWGLIASMYIGNILLLVLNLPLIGVWVKVLKIPYPILFPLVMLLCIVGAYSTSYQIADIWLLLFFGLVGWAMRKYGYEGAPLVLAMLLGPKVEGSLRQSLILSDGSFAIFFTRPLCCIMMTVALVLLFSPLLPWFRRKPLPKEA